MPRSVDRSVPAVSRRSRGAIQAEAVDLGRDGGGDEAVDRQPRRDPVADLRRRDVERRDREELDPVGPRRAWRTTRSSSARSVPGRVAAPMRASSSTRSGRVQVGNAASSSAPIRKTGSSRPSASSESTVRANGSSDTSASSIVAKASSASAKPDLRRRVDVLVARDRRRRGRAAASSRKWSIASRASATCPLCGGSKAPPKIPTPRSLARSTTSSPISTSEPGLTPASRSASSSSSPSGAVPTTRKPWPVRSTRNRRRSGGRGRYSRNVRQLLRDGRGLGDLLRAEREEQRLQLVDARTRSRTRSRCTATMRSSSTVNGAGSGSRSDLLRTTSCGRSPRPAP